MAISAIGNGSYSGIIKANSRGGSAGNTSGQNMTISGNMRGQGMMMPGMMNGVSGTNNLQNTGSPAAGNSVARGSANVPKDTAASASVSANSGSESTLQALYGAGGKINQAPYIGLQQGAILNQLV